MSGPPPLTWELPAAGFMHVMGFLVVLVARCDARTEPLFRPDEVMIVEMAGPAKQITAMPQKAERAPPRPKGAEAPATEPPPPNQSDMAIRTPDAPKIKGDPNAAERDRLLAAMRREALLNSLPEGQEDRPETSPDGSESEASASASAGIHDPALAKWRREAEALLNANFHPLRSYCQADPKLAAVAVVAVAADGRMEGDAKIVTGSRNTSIDSECLRAFTLTGRLPPTPPNRDGLNAQLTCRCPK